MTSKGVHLVVREGDVINLRFKVLREVGCGNFSKVYCCYDLAHPADGERRLVAVKIIKREYRKDAYFEKQMLELLRKKDGKKPSVSHMIYFFEWRRCPVIVMTIHGPALRKRRLGYAGGIVRRATLLRLAYWLLKTLYFLHFDCRMVHTDLKPENILLADPETPDNSLGNSWVVCDFGSSSFWRMDRLDSDLISTRPYRAPEVVLGNPWFYAADIWSAGCVLFEIAKGNQLFEVDEDVQHLQMMESRLGPFPEIFTMRSKYSKKFFNEDGDLFCRSHVTPSTARGVKLSEMLSDDPELYDLISLMLIFDPAKRVTAKEAMKLPIFDAIRSANDLEKSKTSGLLTDAEASNENLPTESTESPMEVLATDEMPSNGDLRLTQSCKPFECKSIKLHPKTRGASAMRCTPGNGDPVKSTNDALGAGSLPPLEKPPCHHSQSHQPDENDGGAIGKPPLGNQHAKSIGKISRPHSVVGFRSSPAASTRSEFTPDKGRRQPSSEKRPSTALLPYHPSKVKCRSLASERMEKKSEEAHNNEVHNSKLDCHYSLLKMRQGERINHVATHVGNTGHTANTAANSSARGSDSLTLYPPTTGVITSFERVEETFSTTVTTSDYIGSSREAHSPALKLSPFSGTIALNSINSLIRDENHSQSSFNKDRNPTGLSFTPLRDVTEKKSLVVPRAQGTQPTVEGRFARSSSTPRIESSALTRFPASKEIVPEQKKQEEKGKEKEPIQKEGSSSSFSLANDSGEERKVLNLSPFSKPIASLGGCQTLSGSNDSPESVKESNGNIGEEAARVMIKPLPNLQHLNRLVNGAKNRCRSCPSQTAEITSVERGSLHPPAPLTLVRRSARGGHNPKPNVAPGENRRPVFQSGISRPDIIFSSCHGEKLAETIESTHSKSRFSHRSNFVGLTSIRNSSNPSNERLIDGGASSEVSKMAHKRRGFPASAKCSTSSDTTMLPFAFFSSGTLPTEPLATQRSNVGFRSAFRGLSHSSRVANCNTVTRQTNACALRGGWKGGMVQIVSSRVSSGVHNDTIQEKKHEPHKHRLPLAQALE